MEMVSEFLTGQAQYSLLVKSVLVHIAKAPPPVPRNSVVARSA